MSTRGLVLRLARSQLLCAACVSIGLALLLGVAAQLPIDTQGRMIGLTLACLALGAWLSVRLASKAERGFSTRLFLGSYLLRLLAGFAIGMVLLASNDRVVFSDDATLFHNQASLLQASGGPWRLPVDELSRHFRSPALVYGSLYTLLGDSNPFLSLLPNILLGALTPVLVWKIAQEVRLSERVARRAGWLMALLPVSVIYSSTHLKEGPVAFAVVALVYLVVTGSRRPLWSTGLLAIPILLVVFLYRDRLGYPLMAAVVVGVVVAKWKGPSVWGILRSPWFLACAAIGVGLAVWLASRGILQSIVGRVLTYDWRLIQQKAAEGPLSPLALVSGSQMDPLRVVGFLPVGVLYLWLLPFPWFVLQEGMYFQTQLLAVANAAWLILLPLFLVGCFQIARHKDRRQQAILLLCLGGSLVMAFSLGVLASYGRHREIIVPLMMIVVAVGWEQFRAWRPLHRNILVGLGIGLFGMATAAYFWNEGWMDLGTLAVSAIVPAAFLLWHALASRRRVTG